MHLHVCGSVAGLIIALVCFSLISTALPFHRCSVRQGGDRRTNNSKIDNKVIRVQNSCMGLPTPALELFGHLS